MATEKILYRGHTIFKEVYRGKTVYRTQGGISRTKFTTLTGAKNAIDRFIKKYRTRG